MTNLEIKKEIMRVTERVKKFEVRVYLWTGDGTYHEGYDVIYNVVDIVNLSNGEFLDNKISLPSDDEELIDNNEGYTVLREEQTKLVAYLKKHFSKVVAKEVTL